MKRANRVLFIALGFFMFMGLVSAVKQPARADGPVYYLDRKDRENDPDDVSLVKKEAANYVVVDSQTISWEAGNIYVVNGNIEIDERITAKGSGDVRLILCDGATLEAPKGITVEKNTAFHIHACSTGADILGTGKLDISPKNGKKVDDECAGIGGEDEKVTGAIFIYGGNIIATGGNVGAGIGGGPFYSFGTIEINGGKITATGGNGGAGIGGGVLTDGGTITINAGEIKATGGNGGAGIGGGGWGCGSDVTINGGIVITAAGDNTSVNYDPPQGIGRGVDPNYENGDHPSPGSLSTASGIYVFGGDAENPTTLVEKTDDDYTRYRYMTVKPHEHSFTYTADGATITAKCNNEQTACTLTEKKATLSIAAPLHTNYGDGKSPEAVIIDNDEIRGDAEVSYYKATVSDGTYTKGEGLTSAPTDIGDYMAEITIGTAPNAATASIGYSIAKGDIPGDMRPTGKTGLVASGEDQALINAPGTALQEGCRIEYALGADDKAVPTDGWGETVPAKKEVGTYYVWYRITGNDNYNNSDPAVITVNIEHKHDPLHYERKEATEDAEGNIEYWECKVCKKLFSDAACTQEIAAENIVIKKLDHDLEHHSRVEPTETTAGNIEYWVCKGCNKFFSDAEGKNEITEAQTVLAKLPDARTVAETPAPVAQTATINDKSVELKTQVSHSKAVTWTGGKITKEQLSALSEDGVIAKIEASGLKEALTKYNDSKVKPSDLFTTSCKITGKDITDSNTKAYFIVKIKLNSKKLKKAGISKDDKKALQAIVDELNKKLENDPYYFEIRPVKLDDEGVTVSVKAAFSKKKFVQKNEDGTAKKIKSVTIKYKVPAGKNGKTKTITRTIKKAGELKKFTVKITDASKKKKAKADITATADNTTFTGTKTGVTVKP